jgi:hypothetical protein
MDFQSGRIWPQLDSPVISEALKDEVEGIGLVAADEGRSRICVDVLHQQE